MKIDFAAAAKIISEQNNILILCHDHPDGDTLGSGFALCRALSAMGKKAKGVSSHTTHIRAMPKL